MIEELETKGTIHCAPTKKQEYRKREILERYWPRNLPGSNIKKTKK